MTIIRWVGGKTKLLSEIRKHIPQNFSCYYEPFIGGAAVLLDIKPTCSVVSDVNVELVNFYQQIKTNHKKVLDIAQNFQNSEESYYEIRQWDRHDGFLARDPIERAARFLFINKTSFQGLWRVNKRGYHNVPYSFPKSIAFDNSKFENFVEITKNTTFLCCEFKETLKTITVGDFVYFDPPYWPISKTSSFTNYSIGGFTQNDQNSLRDCCIELDKNGIKFLLSNSDCVETRKLYEMFHIETVVVNRSVAAKNSSRGNLTEILVKN